MKEKNLMNIIITSLLVFIIGGIVGYIYEEIFYLIQDGVLYNRGVLFGPFLPVYAFGALFMYFGLNNLRKHPILIFFIAMIITGVLEYATGYYLKNVSKEVLWDYTNEFLNIDGMVCLRSVTSFAVGGLFLIYFVVPFLNNFIKHRKICYTIIIISFIILFTDMILTGIYSK